MSPESEDRSQSSQSATAVVWSFCTSKVNFSCCAICRDLAPAQCARASVARLALQGDHPPAEEGVRQGDTTVSIAAALDWQP